ncbi:MAG: hypothetical protein LBP86_05650 [Azoarcus sp.]|jgi:nitrous oxide reductase accessory protein NosL|nr:hypothetical protein [Azoarcus sp.]
MKHSLLTATLLALAVSACGQKEEPSSPVPDVPAEQPAAPVDEAPVDSTPAPEAGNTPAEAVPESAAPISDVAPESAEPASDVIPVPDSATKP